MVNKILIADDDVQMVNAVKTLLENVGYDTVSTNDPKEVIELARKEMPDLIMLDVMFEGMTGPNGFELSRKIASDKDLKKIPVIILSGVKKVISSDFEVTPDKEWLPIAAFLDKPVKPDQLLREINNLMHKRS